MHSHFDIDNEVTLEMHWDIGDDNLLVWARIFLEAAKGVEYSNPTHFYSMASEDLISLSLTTSILTEEVLE